MSTLFQKITGLGSSPADRLINNLLNHYRKWRAEPSDDNHYAFVECVGEHLNIIDAQFIGYLNRKVANERQDSDLAHMQDLLHKTQFSIVLDQTARTPTIRTEAVWRISRRAKSYRCRR